MTLLAFFKYFFDIIDPQIECNVFPFIFMLHLWTINFFSQAFQIVHILQTKSQYFKPF